LCRCHAVVVIARFWSWVRLSVLLISAQAGQRLGGIGLEYGAEIIICRELLEQGIHGHRIQPGVPTCIFTFV